MRRILPLLLLPLGFAAFIVTDTAEARHCRHRCRQRCCPCYQNCQETTTTTYCPQYKMMSLGGMNNYFTYEYTGTTCIPMSYGTTGTVTYPCDCPPGSPTCCFTVIQLVGLSAKSNPGDHVNGNTSGAHVPKNIPPKEPFEVTCAYDPSLDKKVDIVVKAFDEENNKDLWVHVAWFKTTKNGSDDIEVAVGYEVVEKSGVPADVDSSNATVTWTPDGSGASVGTLKIEGNHHPAKFNKTYQIVLATD